MRNTLVYQCNKCDAKFIGVIPTCSKCMDKEPISKEGIGVSGYIYTSLTLAVGVVGILMLSV